MKLFLCLLALVASSFAQQLQFAALGDFKLESGETLRDCRIGYRTFGQLNPDKSNAVLIPTWAGGTTEQLMSSIGGDGLVDPAKYYVILVDALANGVSSSPSNNPAQPRMKFPEITIRDMVNTQHALAMQVLHLSHVKAVIGISMGGMQAFQWMVSILNSWILRFPLWARLGWLRTICSSGNCRSIPSKAIPAGTTAIISKTRRAECSLRLAGWC